MVAVKDDRLVTGVDSCLGIRVARVRLSGLRDRDRCLMELGVGEVTNARPNSWLSLTPSGDLRDCCRFFVSLTPSGGRQCRLLVLGRSIAIGGARGPLAVSLIGT